MSRIKKLFLLAGMFVLLTCVALLGSCAQAQGEEIEYPTEHGTMSTEDSADGGKVTVLVYMNGSDLESDGGEASIEISEMLASNCGENVNVVIETLGTKSWQGYGIASDRSQRYAIENGKLVLVDDSLDQLDATAEETFSDFISWGTANYPADRYMVILWDHGGGPVIGFGVDEIINDDSAALTLDEMQQAFEENPQVHFDFIGMDCCIMASLETCCVLSPFCDYSILSEDFESNTGWYYTNWLEELEKDPTVSVEELGTTIVDDMIASNEESGQDGTLAVINESKVSLLYSAWIDFAYANEDALLQTNYSQETENNRTGTSQSALGPLDFIFSGAGNAAFQLFSEQAKLDDYYITDMMATATSIGSEQADALGAALDECLVYYKATEDDKAFTGMAVTLPYGDADFYDLLKTVFTDCGFDSEYIEWLGKFVDASGQNSYEDFNEFEQDWDGWSGYDDDFNWDEWDLQDENGWESGEDSDWGWQEDQVDPYAPGHHGGPDQSYYYEDYGYDDGAFYYEDYWAW